ncbi:hypothetical protein EXVG_00035 [Emiliania huxleyi virus 202]|nr:hypothetical protein EXVG_00035 [Emiliania huxleyi virus 202]AHA54518.1 hypothetical protein EhV18_00472 [Emiliania huxleyi virus 18]AHA55557.1 hypothetical protein EhV156_00462 [Emiliania huxleyi virus 156]
MLNEYVLVKSQKSMDELDKVPIPLHRTPVAPEDKGNFYVKTFEELLQLYLQLSKDSPHALMTSVIKEELERRIFVILDNKVSRLTLLVNEPFNDDAIMLYENTRQSLMRSKELYLEGKLTISQFSNSVRVF